MRGLVGRINFAFFDRKAAEWLAEEDCCLATMASHKERNKSSGEQAIRWLELARNAHLPFPKNR